MPVPKKKTSNSRQNSRRAHWKAGNFATVECSNCKAAKLPHKVCPECGYYDKRSVANIKTDEA